MRINPANIISIARAGTAFWVVFLLIEVQTYPAALLAVALVSIAVLFDALDGVIARAFACESKIGEACDICADHILANLLWIGLAQLGCVSVWVPILTSTRDTLVDCMRLAQLYATHLNFFEQVGETRFRWIVSSRCMRGGYGALKLLSWIACIVSLHHPIDHLLQALVALTLIVCFIRAIPAVAASWRYIIFRPA